MIDVGTDPGKTPFVTWTRGVPDAISGAEESDMTNSGTTIAETLPWEALDRSQQAQALGMFDMHEGALSLHYYRIAEDGNVVERVRNPVGHRGPTGR